MIRLKDLFFSKCSTINRFPLFSISFYKKNVGFVGMHKHYIPVGIQTLCGDIYIMCPRVKLKKERISFSLIKFYIYS